MSTKIIGLGALTPLGRGVVPSIAAARAGICGFGTHPYLVDGAGEPMRIAAAASLAQDLDGVGRCWALLASAMDEALASIPTSASLALALGLPPERPGRVPDLAEKVRLLIRNHYEARFHPVLTFETGHAATLQGLHAAMASLAKGTIKACLVAGVDSYLQPETLEWLESCEQLHGAGPLNNAWGFVPGEAASALVLAAAAGADEMEAQVLGEIVQVAIGRETKLIKTDAVCTGDGLTQAFREALASLAPGTKVANVFCDLNGEPYRADEYSFTALRTKQHFRAASDFIAPADCWGDVGAAGPLLHIAMALACCSKGYGHGPQSLVWASSEGGERAAALLSAPFVSRA